MQENSVKAIYIGIICYYHDLKSREKPCKTI